MKGDKQKIIEVQNKCISFLENSLDSSEDAIVFAAEILEILEEESHDEE